MDYQILSVVAAFVFVYSLVASRLQHTLVSGALVYVIVGFLCGPDGFGLVDIKIEGEGLKTLAELTLALVLFTDSANTNLKLLPPSFTGCYSAGAAGSESKGPSGRKE